jgi:DNA-binding response OmpR family regulator
MGGNDGRPDVVLADDDGAITSNLAPFLDRAGFTVHVASDGEAALELVERLDPDGCILDVLMPGPDGREVLRRARPGRRPLSAAPTLRAGDLRMDRISRRAWLRDAELVLTPKAALLLDYLITHPDELLTRDRLLEVLWGFDFPVGTRAVDDRIAELRRALADDPVRPQWIATIPGQGYRFVARVDDVR